MKGVDKETFLAISSDKKSAGLLYDALTEIYDMVAACDDRFVTKTQAKWVGVCILCILLGLGIVKITDLSKFL